MSTSKYTYTGVGIRLANSKTYDVVNHRLERIAAEKGGSWSGDLVFEDKHLQIINDGMNGNYIYLFYIFSMVDGWSGTGIDTDKSYTIGEMISRLQEAYCQIAKAYYDLEFTNLDNSEVRFMTLEHWV